MSRPIASGSTSWASWRTQAEPISSGGLSIATYDLGGAGGRPLTFLHGYPSSSLDIALVANDLGPPWRVLAVDFPGFGASDKPADHGYSIHAAADAVEQMWRTKGIDSTIVVAHDYGVSVGQELLARRLDGSLGVAVDAVVWMNGGLYPDLHRPTVGQQLLLDEDGGAELAASLTRDLFVAGIGITWGTRVEMNDDEVGEIWESMAERGGVARMHDLLHYVADRKEHESRWRAALESTDVPTAFVWGDLDPVSGAHMIERVQTRVPNARVERLDDVGHWPLLEAPDVVADAIRDLAAGG
jgi:pimeloyl-ACP methyl ester carboxylesterase